MPPRGVKKGNKRARQYEHIKEGARGPRESEDTAEEIAARTVNKERARAGEAAGESHAPPTTSRRAGAVGCARTEGPGGRTKDQLYKEARQKGIKGRSKMNKAEPRTGSRRPSLTDEPAALLGLPVRADGVRLGTVGAVWVDAADRVLGMEIRGKGNKTGRYLPYQAARLENDIVEASPIAILAGIEPVGFLRRRGARRVTQADDR